MIKRLILLLILLPAFADANSVYWGSSKVSGYFSSAFEACEEGVKSKFGGNLIDGLGNVYEVTLDGPYSNGTQYLCYYNNVLTPSNSINDGIAQQYVCSNGLIFNPATGTCDAAPECTEGIEITRSGSSSYLPQTLCIESCQYDHFGIGMSSTAYSWWRGTYASNGNSCTGTDTSYDPTETPSPEDLADGCRNFNGTKVCDNDPENPGTNCAIYNGVQVCPDDPSDPNDQPDPNDDCAYIKGKKVCSNPDDQKNCNLVAGRKICVEDSQEDNSDKKDGVCYEFDGKTICISTETKTTSSTSTTTTDNGDGTQTTTTTTTTVDNVSGNGSTTTTTIDDGHGNQTTTIQTQGNTPDGADGDGDQSGEDAEGDEKESASLNGCDEKPTCEGGPIACSALEIEWANACNTVWTNPIASDLLGSETDNPHDSGDTIDVSDYLDQDGFGLSRTCPAGNSFSVMGHTFQLDMSPFCQMASVIGFMVIFTASIVGIRIISGGIN